MTYPPPPGPVLGGLVHWRKNPLLATSMEPIVMTLVAGRFTGTDRHGTPVFDAHASEVSGRLGSMGTLKITVRGQKFAIVGRGSAGGLEDAVAPAQIAHLQQFFQQFPQAAAVQRGPAGPIDAVFNASAAATLAVWRDALAASGAAVS